MRIFNYLKDHLFYLIEWKLEMNKEIRYEKNGKRDYYLKKWYKRNTGEPLDLENPITFTEKQQWLKIFSTTKKKTACADKYRVREYVKEIIGEEYLIPIITINGIDCFKNPYDISFDLLPQSFVIQCNHGAHMTHIVKNKSKVNFRLIQLMLSLELRINYAYCHGYELQYKDIEPCIFITDYMDEINGLPDYKFFYFYGKMQYFSVDQDRFNNHKRTIFDSNYNVYEYQCSNYPAIDFQVDMELCMKMEKIARKLAKDFDHVRVDFYYYNGQIYFGELTFTSASGIKKLHPSEANYLMSDLIDIEQEKRYYDNKD